MIALLFSISKNDEQRFFNINTTVDTCSASPFLCSALFSCVLLWTIGSSAIVGERKWLTYHRRRVYMRHGNAHALVHSYLTFITPLLAFRFTIYLVSQYLLLIKLFLSQSVAFQKISVLTFGSNFNSFNTVNSLCMCC